MSITAPQPRIRTHWMPCGRRENTQDYYVVREAVADYLDYWEPKADPDGAVRDRNTDEECRQYWSDVADEIDFVNGLNPAVVTDFGAGLGWFLRAITGNAMKTAIEACPQARERLRGIAHYIFESLDDCQSFQTEDVVIAHHVFEHLPDPIHAIVRIRDMLMPGGYLVLGTPDFASPCAKRFGENYRMLHDKTHCSLFTLESMTRFLRDYGFTILDVKFPFPERYATAENFMRWNDTSKMSPPWPGNWMTFYARRA